MKGTKLKEEIEVSFEVEESKLNERREVSKLKEVDGRKEGGTWKREES